MTLDILLVNDDGIDSPALLPTLEVLDEIGSVTAVIPKKQQSWTSKINTRSNKQTPLEQRLIGDFECFTVDLYPADCANLGIYLKDKKPDIVISGANVGHNVGLHAFFSSGTVGAAIEGVIAGIPSIAISCAYQPNQTILPDQFRTSLSIIPNLMKAFLVDHHEKALLNLNLPLGIESSDIIAVEIDRFNFGSLFNIDTSTVTPKHYYDLHQPFADNIGTDTWARKEKKACLTAFNYDIQVLNVEMVQNWLNQNDLCH